MVQTKSSSQIVSNAQKRKGFHGKYLSVCKSKNLNPLNEVKKKQKNYQELDFHADRLRVQDWLAVCKSLHSDKTLKFAAIRLRKNNEQVLDDVDTLKKATALTSLPVVYSTFIFTELIETLQNFLTHNSTLDELILEGLPLNGQFMDALAKGLANNKSLRHLSFARSQIDESCEKLCATIKHLMNIETLDLSGCKINLKGAEAVANLIRFLKIQRFSEAWSKSLRYQNVDPESFAGLRKISLSDNLAIGDEGVELLTEVLKEDAWIKTVELQNCGLTDVGANHVISCLNVNKTITNFNISRNPSVSEHFLRHIAMSLGNSESEDSSDSKSSTEKVTKAKLLKIVKHLEVQLELEIFQNKKMQESCDKQQKLLIEFQKELSVQGSVRIPEGFTLVPTSELEKILHEKFDVVHKSTIPVPRRRRRLLAKTKSCVIMRPSTAAQQMSKSATGVKTASSGVDPIRTIFERSIGDTQRQGLLSRSSAVSDVTLVGSPEGTNTMSSAEIMRMLAKMKKDAQLAQNSSQNFGVNFDPRSLFRKSAKRVPPNSDAESD